MRKLLIVLVSLLLLRAVLICGAPNSQKRFAQEVVFADIKAGGEIYLRAQKNFDRLETDIYTPYNVFPVKHHHTSEGWPGDKEGRTILGLVMEAQATHRTPIYLDEMIKLIPTKLNKSGYLGSIQGDTLNEQQLSGHGWFLRGLCEYYIWKKDENIKRYIQSIIHNLVLPTKGYHKNYPISPDQRRSNIGEMAGTTQNVVNKWLLSSDVGCDFIFLDGVVQAYSLFPSKDLKELIDEMVASFLRMDLVTIKAQTHATLTGLRALVRYYEITGNSYLLKEVEKRYNIYRSVGMTENYENFNWFGRPEWTEPCAIIDSYILSVQLWKYTRNPQYIEDAQHIYYNAICHTQRANGGFGCDNCPGSKDLCLSVKAYEAFWCCTMRGGEGLARAIQYSYFTQAKNVYIPFLGNNEAVLTLNGKRCEVKQTTTYPFGTKTIFVITPLNGSIKAALHLFTPIWIKNPKISLNGENISFIKKNGFIVLDVNIKCKSTIEFSFDMQPQIHETVNPTNTIKGSFAFVYGPLLLGYSGETDVKFNRLPTIEQISKAKWKVSDNENSYEFTPIYHLLDESLLQKEYKKQILFMLNEN